MENQKVLELAYILLSRIKETYIYGLLVCVMKNTTHSMSDLILVNKHLWLNPKKIFLVCLVHSTWVCRESIAHVLESIAHDGGPHLHTDLTNCNKDRNR
jgi:hypothetical protein